MLVLPEWRENFTQPKPGMLDLTDVDMDSLRRRLQVAEVISLRNQVLAVGVHMRDGFISMFLLDEALGGNRAQKLAVFLC